MTQKLHQLSDQNKKSETHFPDLMDGLGKFPWEDYHINIDKDVQSKRTDPRSVPVHKEKAVKEEIDKMLAGGVIVSVYKAISWFCSLTINQSRWYNKTEYA